MALTPDPCGCGLGSPIDGLKLGFDLVNIVVWSKSNGGQRSFWRSQHELLPVFKKGSASPLNNVELGRFGRFGRWRSNVWRYPGASSVGSDAPEGLAVHPTVKPRAQPLLEPFAGSGSTLIAARATDRICRAIEIEVRRQPANLHQNLNWSTFSGVTIRAGPKITSPFGPTL